MDFTEIINMMDPDSPETRAVVCYKDIAQGDGSVVKEAMYIESCKHGSVSVYDKHKNQALKKECVELPSVRNISDVRQLNTLNLVKTIAFTRMLTDLPKADPGVEIFYLGRKISIWPDVISNDVAKQLDNIVPDLYELLASADKKEDGTEGKIEKSYAVFSYKIEKPKVGEYEDIRFCKMQVMKFEQEKETTQE